MSTPQNPPGRSGRPAGQDPDLGPPPEPAGRHRAAQPSAMLRFADHAAGACADLLALAVPVDCVACGAEDHTLCVPCQRRLRLLTRQPFRAESGAPALMDVDGAVLLPVVAAGVYREELAQSLLSFKRHGQHQLRECLARALAGAVQAAVPHDAGGTALVPVPTSTAAYLSRGFSPVHLLLAAAGRQLPGMVVANVLAKSRTAAGWPPRPLRGLSGGGQKGLGRGARASRVRGSMRVRRAGVAGLRCIIVDDVLTTGATLSEAARALHAGGAKVSGAVVLAAARPPDAAVAGQIGVGRAPLRAEAAGPEKINQEKMNNAWR
ncbi:ComF family protein [Pseudarthrobacter sp. NPDC058362]|uniref:ComF family protein n=1 Tax=unclassified Pseudarthrobacter TaxID=2647000 RepID=UPI003656E209